MSQLLANHVYYFQVVSRDSAGNAATDNNQGAFYSFTTPKTLHPPWFDNLESGASNWTVVPDTSSGLGSSLNWTLGTPNNGLQTNAYSGVNAWGSDLNGGQIPFSASSYLYSPVIDLTGFSQATLTFWDCFDFSEIFFDPTILSKGKSASAPIRARPRESSVRRGFQRAGLGRLGNGNGGFDALCRPAIQIVWDYLGFDGGTSYGWLVDDIGVTGVGAGAGGTIVVSKNIGFGEFYADRSHQPVRLRPDHHHLQRPAGAVQRAIRRRRLLLYAAGQTNTLMASNTLTFTGTYTFPDVNSNGMSDLLRTILFRQRLDQSHPADGHRWRWHDRLRRIHRRHRSDQRSLQPPHHQQLRHQAA